MTATPPSRYTLGYPLSPWTPTPGPAAKTIAPLLVHRRRGDLVGDRVARALGHRRRIAASATAASACAAAEPEGSMAVRQLSRWGRRDDSMEVLAIWRYPVKAMLGESLDAVHIGPGGCEGDRRFVVVDASSGERIANKRGPTDSRLRACRARLLGSRDDGTGPPGLCITLPGGATAEGADVEPALSDLLDRPVRLAAGDTPARGTFTATGAFHDLAPIHLIATSTLAALRAAEPRSDWDVRRFRPNLVLDDGSPATTRSREVGG